jgi:hypothetical protein
VSVPFSAASITAVGNVFWVCGADEMIASSSDGGSTWQLKHQSRGGEVLLNIAFVNDKVGHAAGTGGRLLTTTDGGKSWKMHNAGESVWMFSFADASNGIAVIGGNRDVPSGLTWGGPTLMDGPVKLTHDGGDHWQDITALTSNELRPFTLVLAVAALDSSHYLMIRRQSQIEDAFVVTQDAGKSWELVHMQNDATNRVLARWLFVHQGEVWAFGMELVHRDTSGGYGVPLTLHSRDGETWVHGVRGSNEFGGCNSQGCYMWDGTVETLYGEREQYWALPQDGSLSPFKWAIAGDHACTITTTTECGPALATEQPQPRSNRPAGSPQLVQTGTMRPPAPAFRAGLPEGCVQCTLDPIPWKLQQRSVLWVIAKLHIGPGGDVKDVALSQRLEVLGPPITQQLSQWRFKPSSDRTEETKDVRLVVQCGFDNAVCQIVPTIAEQ